MTASSIPEWLNPRTPSGKMRSSCSKNHWPQIKHTHNELGGCVYKAAGYLPVFEPLTKNIRFAGPFPVRYQLWFGKGNPWTEWIVMRHAGSLEAQ